jgi:polyisoprenoid-binding protein YceI
MQLDDQARGNIRLSTAKMPQAMAVRYVIDAKGSAFTVRAFATGLLAAFAHSPTIEVRDFAGEVSLNPDAVEQSSMRMVIQSASLNVTGDLSEKDHLEINRKMHEEVLETEGYPEIVYECSKVSATQTGEGQYSATLNGELTLLGVTRDQPVTARASLNGDTLRAMGDFSVRMSDYEIQPVTAAGGTIKLKDELKLSFNISARK